MREYKSYILTNLEEKIKFLNSVNYDYQVIKNPGLSTSKLHEIRRQFHLGSYKEALRKQIEEEIRDSLRSNEYDELCKFLMENGFERDITLIPDEALRIKFLKRMENQTSKAIVLASISDDELKKEYLKGLKKESDRLIVLSSLSSDEEKLKYFDRITDYHKQADLIASLDSDDLKLEYIFSGKIRPYTIVNVVETLKDDKKKAELIDLVPSDTARLRVILSIKDDDVKKQLFDEKIQSDSFKQRKRAALILSLSIDEQLRRFSEFDDGLKVSILQNCDFETQMKLLPLISEPEKKNVVLGRMPAEFLIKYMAFNYSDTTNFWVRTDSEEREANVPRDDREEIASEIVSYSDIPYQSKVSLIRAYIKDKKKIRELLSVFPYENVISDFFMIKDGLINIARLKEIQEYYDISWKDDIELTADRNFDFNNPENLQIIEAIKQMNYPRFVLDKVTYDEYKKWQKVFEGSDVRIEGKNINIIGLNLSVEELKDLAKVCSYVIVDGEHFQETERCAKIAEFSRDIFPEGESEKFETIRKSIETYLMSGYMGPILIDSKKTFLNAGFSEDELKEYGERLVSGLYNEGIKKRVIYGMSLNEESVQLLHEWDTTHSILKNDLHAMSSEMTKDGIKKAIEIVMAEGLVSEEFAVSHVLDFLSTTHIPDRGLEYGKRIALELLHTQNLNIDDLKNLKPGAFSDVFSVGDFVLKLGIARQTKEIPKHDRILPSLLRFEIEEGGNAVSTFIEVQPKVSICQEDDEMMHYGSDIMYDVYSDLRDSHIVWGDVASRNLGFVASDIVIPDGLFSRLRKELEMTEGVTTYHEDSPKFVSHEKDRFGRPYLYVVDTDFLYQIDEEKDNSSLSIPSDLSYQYEHGYQNIKEYQKQINSQNGKKTVQKLRKDIDSIFDEF